MAIKGTINTMVDGVLQEYFPKTTYDSVVDGTSNLKTDIDALKSFKTTAGSKLDGIANNATKTEKSTTNGNIKINGTETTVYTHPSNSNTRHVTDAQITSWTAKETTSGAQSKADAALTSAKAYTDTKVAAMVASAPETLDTLNELAAALGNDPNFATTIATQIGTKVDKVTGKGLSTNDYTTAEKNKLAGIATGANNYTHPTTSGNKHIPSGGSAGQILRWSADGTAAWGADNNTTYSVATTTANGLMSAADKVKLDGATNLNTASKLVMRDASGNFSAGTITASLNGNASTASKWATARTITLTGTVKGSTAIDGSGNVTIATTPRGGRIDASFMTRYRTQTKGDSNAGDYINAIRNDTASVANSPQFGSGLAFGNGDTHGYFYMSYSSAQAYVGAGNADKLNWVKEIAFKDSSITGNAATATKLATARTITIGSKGKTFDGSANVTWTLTDIGAASTAVATSSANGLMSSTDKTKLDGATNVNTASKIVMRDASGNFSAGTITASLSGNASTATKLATARTITIGSRGKTFDGSANVTWTLAEIGAASTAVATTSANGLMSSTDKSKLDTLSTDVSLQNKAKVVYNSTTESIDFIFA